MKTEHELQTMRANIKGIIEAYASDYMFLAEQDELYHHVTNMQENEARQSEMALIDGFISALKGVLE